MKIAKLVPVGYGIQKLQIATVVEDDKVSVDWYIFDHSHFQSQIDSLTYLNHLGWLRPSKNWKIWCRALTSLPSTKFKLC